VNGSSYFAMLGDLLDGRQFFSRETRNRAGRAKLYWCWKDGNDNDDDNDNDNNSNNNNNNKMNNSESTDIKIKNIASLETELQVGLP